MKRRAIALAALGVTAALAPWAARASATTYQYRIEHARYGDIGTYSNTIKRSGDSTEIDTVLHVAVKVLGIVMYRQDAKRTEHWQNGRLVSFAGVTITNGKKIELKGAAKGDDFVLATPQGTETVPGRVHPSNPWEEKVLDTDLMMSTKNGRVDRVHVSGGKLVSVTFDGRNYRLRRFEIDSNKRQFVWFDDRGVAVAFRTEEDGAPVDFVLIHQAQTEAQNRAGGN